VTFFSMGFFDDEIEALKAQGLFRGLRTVGGPVLNFCSNDYLGLASDPRLKAAAKEAVDRYGAGSGAARLISGNNPLCGELEESLADLKGTEAALLFNSGYHANIGVIPALAREGHTIFSDDLNHASLIDGCRLSKAETEIYRHNDLNDLEGVLCRRGAARRATARFIIVTEAVFSMEGDVCPLDDLLALAKKYDALVYLDEAHAVGVFGKEGEGLAPRNPPENLICMGTLGKAFGSYGAFVAGSRSLRDYLINTARSFIFTTALPPAAVGASLKAVKIVREEPERRRRLWENVRLLAGRGGLAPPLQSPIASIRIGDASKTMEISQGLLDRGYYVQGIRPPTVPEGTSRLRLTVSAVHTPEQIDSILWAIRSLCTSSP
jgi:8-amino-7-oxononanoate synthase